jgi:glycosyltransferase involved in cell wall biosynthesis
MNKPLVSVILPVHNAASYVEEAVQSILNQTYGNLELIVVDDGCTDSSMDKIHSLSDSRIVVIRNPSNSGLAASLNVAIGRASGSFLARMDADDISSPVRIEQQLRALEENPSVSVLGTGLRYFGFSAYKNYFPLTHDLCKAKLLFNVCFGHSSLMFRKEVFARPENLYNHEFKQYSEDYDLYVRLVTQYQFANLKNLYVRYRTFKPALKEEAEDKRRINSRLVRNRFLNAMGVVPSAGEMEMHCQAADFAAGLEKKTIMEIASWFDRLFQANNQSGFIDRAALKATLGEQLYLLVYKNPHLAGTVKALRDFNFFADYQVPVGLSFRYKVKQVKSLFSTH